MCSDPFLVLSELRAECAKPSANVFWCKAVTINVQRLLGINTRDELLRFISGKAIEPLIFLEVDAYRESGPNQGALIYSYSFKTTSRDCYLAIFKAKTGTWIIKSIHEPNLALNRDITTLAMKNLGITDERTQQREGDK